MTHSIYLSHPLNAKTPAYKGGEGLIVKREKSISCGDTCNQLHVSMSNHLGTHVDAPSHFVDQGKTLTDYDANDWIFSYPSLIDCGIEPGGSITPEFLKQHIQPCKNVDLLLFKTGMENHRDTVTYWQSSPIIDASIVPLLEEYYPNLKAIGLDVISVTSLLDRDQGRKIHQALLGQGIRIFEDVALDHIKRELKEVIALPLMLEAADGAPVTMIGML
ncbi:MAG: hypothetical protein CMF41_01805 [Legionellales bacterium]|nr:hypothetical protein [Legionellales bacterium]OUX65887.1 MAG: hypothetical protein CBE41_01000 [Gammaproteobacteria bacterium TMED281]